MSLTLEVRSISESEHLAYIASRPSVSFLQTPAWGRVKLGWQARSLGWFAGDELVGAGLVLLRKVPRIDRYLAYLPEGPDLDWSRSELVVPALEALKNYCRTLGAFQVTIGPHAWVRRWSAATLKDTIAAESATRIGDIAADDVSQSGRELSDILARTGWQRGGSGEGFGDFQPRYVFALDLCNRTTDELLSGFNQLWRRNIKKAAASGVTVRVGTEADLSIFHECYVETAKRDGFTPRPLSYFQNMWQHMTAEAPERLMLFIAEHPDHDGAIAATTMTRVGDHAWYSYGASTTAARELRPSNAIQWAMIQHAQATGAAVYDMRGISDNLDPNDHLFGLVQFKLGTGGYAQEYVGEWDAVLRPLWARAYRLYMARR